MGDLPAVVSEGFAGVAVLGPSGTKVLAPIARAVLTAGGKGFPKRLKSRQRAAEVRKLLGVRAGDDLYYRAPAATHPLLQSSSPHPDDLTAFLALAGPSLYAAFRNGWLEEVEALEVDLEQDLVLIGSPEVDALTRLLFDYRRLKSGAGVKYVGSTVAVPYRWHEDPTTVADSCSRYVSGYGEVVRPNWPLVKVALDSGVETRFIPRTEGFNNRLQNDYLLITSMPNFITHRSLDSGKRVISFGGVHGVGTASVAQLLKSRLVLDAVGDRLIGREHGSIFQVLIEAYDLDHDSARGSRAKKVRLVDVWSEEVPYDHLLAAKNVVAKRFSDWVIEGEYRHQPNPGERL